MLMPVRAMPLPRGPGAEPPSCSACQVRPHALFGAVEAAALDEAPLAVKPVALEPGERLYAQGDSGWSVFTVREGIVRFERFSERGERRIVRLAGPGALIGQEAILQRPYVDDVVACTPARICRIPRNAVERLAQQQPSLVRELMNRWQTALEAAAQWTTDLNSGPARRRVLKLLHQLQQLQPPQQVAGARAPIWLPQRDEMGLMLGMAQETASRIVSLLRREGVLEPCGPGRAWVDAELLRLALLEQDRLAG